MLKPIVTDLSVKLTDLKAEDVRELLVNTKQDQWVAPFINQIVEDFGTISYGMGGPEYTTVRDLAVHAYNRFAYYNARVNSRDGNAHQFMDLLLAYTGSMEGSIPTALRYRQGDLPYMVHEQLGKFNFTGYIKNVPELAEKWQKYGWVIQPTSE